MNRTLLMALSALGLSAHAGEAEQVFARVRDSVVTIVALDERGRPDAEGSGVVIGSGQVVTNCHVVQDATTIKVKAQAKEFAASVSLTDGDRDLCALEVPGLVAPAAKVRSHKDVKVGERAYAVGNPLGFELSVSAGLISSLGQYRGEPQLYTSAALSPGSSGGGLFDGEGRLIGITTSVLAYGQNVNVAVPADWISELSRRGTRPPAAKPAVPPDPNWTDQAEALRAAGKWAQLLDLSRQWQLAYPTSTGAQAMAGLALLNLDRPKEAREVLLRATQANPKHATARAYLGLVRDRLGETQAALEDLRAAIDLSPSNAFYRRARADIYFRSRQFELALAQIQDAIRFDPGDEITWQLLGAVARAQNQFEEAARAYRTALRINPNAADARGGLAASLAALGQAAAARDALAGAPGGRTHDTTTWMQIAVEEHRKRRYGDAEKAYRKAVELNPAYPEAWFGLGDVLSVTNRPTDAEEALRTAIKHKPDYGAAWLALGDLLDRRGDKEQAEAAFEKATTFDAASGRAWRRLAYARRDKRDWRAAVVALEKVTELEPTASADWAMLGEARSTLQRWDQAFAALQQAEKLDPKNETALHALGAYYGRRGDFAQSLGYLERALEVNPASSNAWSSKGYSLLKLQRYDQAAEALQTAVRLQPDNANAWINLGETYLRQGQLAKAIAVLERACKLAPQAVDSRLYAAQAYLASGQAAKAKEHLDALLLQQRDQPMAWYMLTGIYISQGKQAETLDAYAQLNRLQPALARDLKEKLRGKQLPGGITLPD